jgi:hypothetical protein
VADAGSGAATLIRVHSSLHKRAANWLLFVLLVVASGCSATIDKAKQLTGQTPKEQHVPGAAPACNNILATWGVSPTGLKFVGCEIGKTAQIRTFVYKYEVSGRDSFDTETLFVDRYGMAPMKRIGPGWEPGLTKDGRHNGFFRDANGYEYEIEMGSGEVTEQDRTNVPFFVSVSLLLDIV